MLLRSIGKASSGLVRRYSQLTVPPIMPPAPPPPPQLLKHRAKWIAPVVGLSFTGAFLYASYQAINTPRIRLLMEEKSPELVQELMSRKLARPFDQVVVKVDRRQIGERLFAEFADSDTKLMKDKALLIADRMNSPALAALVKAVLQSRRFGDSEFLTPDQFAGCFDVATHDIPDPQLYLLVRDEFGIVPISTSLFKALVKVYTVCRETDMKFNKEQIRNLCDMLGVAFYHQGEPEQEFDSFATKPHKFINYFARKYADVSEVVALVNVRNFLVFWASQSSE